MYRRILLLAALLALGACESDTSKLERLRRQETVTNVQLVRWQHTVDSLLQKKAGAWNVDSELAVARDSLREAQDRQILAKRALDRFLH